MVMYLVFEFFSANSCHATFQFTFAAVSHDKSKFGAIWFQRLAFAGPCCALFGSVNNSPGFSESVPLHAVKCA